MSRKQANVGGFKIGAGSRSRLGRMIWGGLSLIAATGCVAAIGTEWASGSNFEPVVGPDGAQYFVDTYDALYFAASCAGAAALFAFWKMCHRSGLGFWRATARPALMSSLAALMGACVTLWSRFAVGIVQDVTLGVLGFSALLFLGLWYLRGPHMTVRRHDDYWQRAWAVVFTCLGLLFLSSGGLAMASWWGDSGFQFERYETDTVTAWPDKACGVEIPAEGYEVPRPRHDPAPIAGGLLLLMALGAMHEARFRWRQASFARELLLGPG